MRPDPRPARKIASDPLVRMQIKLLEIGFPFDVVDVLSENELFGYCVAIGEVQGGKFDWNRMDWEEPKATY